MKYYIIYKQAGKEEEQMAVYGDQIMAINQARQLDSQLASWETIQIRKIENSHITTVPFKVYIAERQSKNIIEEIKGQELDTAIEEAIGIIADYEKDDQLADMYVPDWYDAVDEFGNSYLYRKEV